MHRNGLPRRLLTALLVSMPLLCVTAPSVAATPNMSPVAPQTPSGNFKANPLMNTPRPILYRELMPFDSEQHRNLTLPAERKNFAFAAQTNLLPLTVAEVSQAARHYPIVFVAEGESVALVAVCGLSLDNRSGNRFIDAQGEWRPGTYIPAYVRGYPFIAIRSAPNAEPVLALDPQAADFKQANGKRLLAPDGQPSEQLKGIMAFHAEYRQLSERTATITKALKEAGVLEEGGLQIQASQQGGDSQRIGGFLVVSEAKLRALKGDALQKLMEADALGLAYAQLLSMASLSNVFAEPALPANSTSSLNAQEKSPAKRSRKKAE